MTDQHTPIPWRVTFTGLDPEIRSGERAIAWVVSRVENQNADADLIVRAVNSHALMLDALKTALAYLESECPHESTDDCTSCALICYDARAAIRAATGEDA